MFEEYIKTKIIERLMAKNVGLTRAEATQIASMPEAQAVAKIVAAGGSVPSKFANLGASDVTGFRTLAQNTGESFTTVVRGALFGGPEVSVPGLPTRNPIASQPIASTFQPGGALYTNTRAPLGTALSQSPQGQAFTAMRAAQPATPSPTLAFGYEGAAFSPPSGGARLQLSQTDITRAIQVAYTEAYGEGPAGMQAVVATLVNRALLNGTSIQQEAEKFRQYEGVNNRSGNFNNPTVPAGKIAEVESAIMPILTGQMADPTGGATHYLNPVMQTARGDKIPNWATAENSTGFIGRHEFFANVDSETATAQLAALTGSTPINWNTVGPIGPISQGQGLPSLTSPLSLAMAQSGAVTPLTSALPPGVGSAAASLAPRPQTVSPAGMAQYGISPRGGGLTAPAVSAPGMAQFGISPRGGGLAVPRPAIPPSVSAAAAALSPRTAIERIATLPSIGRISPLSPLGSNVAVNALGSNVAVNALGPNAIARPVPLQTSTVRAPTLQRAPTVAPSPIRGAISPSGVSIPAVPTVPTVGPYQTVKQAITSNLQAIGALPPSTTLTALGPSTTLNSLGPSSTLAAISPTLLPSATAQALALSTSRPTPLSESLPSMPMAQSVFGGVVPKNVGIQQLGLGQAPSAFVQAQSPSSRLFPMASSVGALFPNTTAGINRQLGQIGLASSLLPGRLAPITNNPGTGYELGRPGSGTFLSPSGVAQMAAAAAANVANIRVANLSLAMSMQEMIHGNRYVARNTVHEMGGGGTFGNLASFRSGGGGYAPIGGNIAAARRAAMFG